MAPSPGLHQAADPQIERAVRRNIWKGVFVRKGSCWWVWVLGLAAMIVPSAGEGALGPSPIFLAGMFLISGVVGHGADCSGPGKDCRAVVFADFGGNWAGSSRHCGCGKGRSRGSWLTLTIREISRLFPGAGKGAASPRIMYCAGTTAANVGAVARMLCAGCRVDIVELPP